MQARLAPPRSFLNFAYGSNMSLARLRERAPSARAVAVAELAGHALRWHKRRVDGSGKCDAYPHAPARMWGVVYEIAWDEKPRLDAAEGLHRGYDEKRIAVVAAGLGALTAQVYVATDIDPALRPYVWYKAFVLAGAAEHGLPSRYVADLERVPALRDPDRERAARNRRVLG